MLHWLLSFFPLVIIYAPDGTHYLRRYKLFRIGSFGIFVHQIMQSDTDRDLHDHPWEFTSIILKSGYLEILPDGCKAQRPGAIIRHTGPDLHAVRLFTDGPNGPEVPAWTLVFVGRKYRDWGFMTEKGWVDHCTYLTAKFGENYGDCGESQELKKEMED